MAPQEKKFIITYSTTNDCHQFQATNAIVFCDYCTFRWKRRWKMSSCHPHMVASHDRWQFSYIFNYNFFFVDHTWCLVKFILQLHIIVTKVCVHGLLMYVICHVNSNNDGVNFQSTTNYTWWKHGKVDHWIKWTIAIKISLDILK
jgi:hypothetical protein